MNVPEICETGVEFGAKGCTMLAMSQFSTNQMTNCICKANPVNNGLGEAFGLRWA